LLSKFLEPLRQTLEQNRLIFNGLIGERGALEYHPKRLREYFSSLPHGDPRKLTWLRRIERLRDNNREILGLRALRTGVQWRKICFGNRSANGEIATARLLTVAESCDLQGLNILAYLSAAIACRRRRQPVASLLRR
jgi:hypothetical protein